MPRMRCIDNSGYASSFTLGNIYDIEIISDRATMCYATTNFGSRTTCYLRRFEAIEENPVQTEPVAEEIPSNMVGKRVRIKTGLSSELYGEHQLLFAEQMFQYCGKEGKIISVTDNERKWYRLNIDDSSWAWCSEMFDVIEEVMPESTGGLTPVSVIADEIAPTVQSTIVIPEYTQLPGNAQMKIHTKILLPTRNTYQNRDTILQPTEDALETGRDFLYITSTMSGSNRVAIGYNKRQTYGYYRLTDLEVYTTKFVEGAIENGHRIKDDCGKTHTFEDYNQTVPNNQTLLEDNDEYITYIDSTGWYIRKWKQLVTKPRGTVQYTEYKAMCPECYAAYKLQQESRMAYLKALKAKKDEENAARLAEERRERERREAEERARREREAERRRIAEEEERQFIERNRNGIWKHHKKG